MKYTPKTYARALVDVVSRAPDDSAKNKLAERFLEMLRKRGDIPRLKKIIFEYENLLQKKEGFRKVIVESARPLGDAATRLFKNIIRKEDAVEERINPELVAGVKITVNGDTQFDGSLKRKLDLLFK